MNQSFFFNSTDNRNDQALTRQYSVPEDSIAQYAQSGSTDNKNYNNRYDARMEVAVDSSNAFVTLPRLYFQRNQGSSASSGVNTGDADQFISQATNLNGSSTTGHNLTDHLIYRHKFDKRGRTLSADLGGGHTLKDGTTQQQSLSQFDQGAASTLDTLDQQTDVRTTTSSVSARSLMEPAFKSGMFSLLQPEHVLNAADNRRTSSTRSRKPTRCRTPGSRACFRAVWVQNAGLPICSAAAAEPVREPRLPGHDARNEASFPASGSLSATFHEWLPSVMFNDNLEGHRNLRVSSRPRCGRPRSASFRT
jgi:hypothetical protein